MRRGKGLGEMFDKVKKFLRRTKLISKAGKIADVVGLTPQIGDLGRYAGKHGFGRKKVVRRRRRGRGISTAGGALSLAGYGRKKRLSVLPRRGIAY